MRFCSGDDAAAVLGGIVIGVPLAVIGCLWLIF